jgi:hypothetical protein
MRYSDIFASRRDCHVSFESQYQEYRSAYDHFLFTGGTMQNGIFAILISFATITKPKPLIYTLSPSPLIPINERFEITDARTVIYKSVEYNNF